VQKEDEEIQETIPEIDKPSEIQEIDELQTLRSEHEEQKAIIASFK